MFQLMKYYRKKPTLAEYFKILINMGKDEDMTYFNQKTINSIKNFWNPLMRHRAEEKFSSTMVFQDSDVVEILKVNREKDPNEMKISIVSDARQQEVPEIDSNRGTSLPVNDYSEAMDLSSRFEDPAEDFEEIDLNKDVSEPFDNSIPSVKGMKTSQSSKLFFKSEKVSKEQFKASPSLKTD